MSSVDFKQVFNRALLTFEIQQWPGYECSSFIIFAVKWSVFSGLKNTDHLTKQEGTKSAKSIRPIKP
jgi:hypothetical protein